MPRIYHPILPAISTDLGEFLYSQDSQNILRFLHLSGGGLLDSPDKAAGNLRVSNLGRDQVERKDKCFNSSYKGIIYQNAVSQN